MCDVKRMDLRVVGAVVAVLAANVACANLLTDEGFEGSGGAAWSPWPSTNAFVYNFDSTAYAKSGSESLEVKWTEQILRWNVFEAKQVVAVNEGDNYSASVYALIPELSPVNNTEIYLETIFCYDAAGNNETGHKLKSDILPGHTTNQWLQLLNSGTVEAGDAYAKYRLVVFTAFEGGSTSGTLYFDDAVADTVIPEPTTAALLGVALLFIRPLLRARKRN